MSFHCPICGVDMAGALSHRCSEASLRRIEAEHRRASDDDFEDEPSDSERLSDGFRTLSMDGRTQDNWWMDFNDQKGFRTGSLAPWSTIVVDNVLHIVTIFLVCKSGV